MSFLSHTRNAGAISCGGNFSNDASITKKEFLNILYKKSIDSFLVGWDDRRDKIKI